MQEKEPESGVHPMDAPADVREPERDPPGCETKLLSMLDTALHEMSQPMTVLLCTLEYGGYLSTVEELKQTLSVAQEQCERLQKLVLGMQVELREAITEARKEQPVG